MADWVQKYHESQTGQKGGPGSGHHGHSGRPGQVGGSAPGEGSARIPRGQLNAKNSGPFSGKVYRAVNSTSPVKAAMGKGTYFTNDPWVAKTAYGTDVREFWVDLDNVLGRNSKEYGWIDRISRRRWTGDESLAQVIATVAKEKGFDAIWGGSVFGLAVFDGGKATEIRKLEPEETR